MSIHVEIVTPTATAWSGDVTEVQAPGFYGEFGVLPDHAPLLSVVRAGVVTLHTSAGEQRFVVGNGFVEAGPAKLTLLTELCEPADNVDKGAASALLAESEAALAASEAGSGEAVNAERNADLARARLSI
jgi:F-type H+-transporting ATPase subunit epsilon